MIVGVLCYGATENMELTAPWEAVYTFNHHARLAVKIITDPVPSISHSHGQRVCSMFHGHA